MAAPRWQDDDALLADLRDALSSAAPQDDDLTALAKGAFAWGDVDAELALMVLTHDSLTDPGPLVRSDDSASTRTLTFEADGISVVLEVVGARLVGQVSPAAPLQIDLETPGGAAATTSADPVGVFSTGELPAGPVRVRLSREGEPVAVSDWVRLLA